MPPLPRDCLRSLDLAHDLRYSVGHMPVRFAWIAFTPGAYFLESTFYVSHHPAAHRSRPSPRPSSSPSSPLVQLGTRLR
jgi:hypothetical protein